MALRLRSILVGAALLVLASPVHAAPQLLGTIATAEPLGLFCEGDTCRAEVATYCMQSHRDTPARDFAYRADDMNVFTVIAKDVSGQLVETTLDRATFHATRGYTVTTVRFPTTSLQERGLTPVGMQIAKGGILVPQTIAGDPDPIGAEEIVEAKATLLPIAEGIFKNHRVEIAALGMVNKVLSEIPAHGRLTPEARENIWESTFGESAREIITPGGSRAADEISYCQARTKQGRFFSVRRCLEQRLDGMLMEINADYWKATKPGY